MKLSDHDTTRESMQMQEFVEEVRAILNNGTYEVETTAAATPPYAAPAEPKIVFSLFGATAKLFIGYGGTWYQVGLTAV